jgi:hypothetical protein
MKEKINPSVYVCVKIALALNRDPSEIIALVEADTEKNEKRKEFWRDFLLRVQSGAKLYTLAVICILTLLGGQPDRAGGFKAA